MSDTYNCQSIDRAMAILELLAESPRPLTLAEVNLALHLHKSTAHRFLQVLSKHGLAERSPRGNWRLGRKLTALGDIANIRNRRDHGRPAAE